MRCLIKIFVIICTAASGLLLMPSCHHIDDDRIPPVPVYLSFPTVAQWDIYGTPSPVSYKIFILSERVPAQYNYTAMSATGFAGVLLCGDVYGAPVAYDLACPVEAKATIRVAVDEATLTARCPHCGSEYDIFSNYGYPLSGRAAELGYGLCRYYVGAGPASEYMIVTRR